METLETLKSFYASNTVKEATINEFVKIKDVSKFAASHLLFLENNSGNKAFKPYFDRLVMVKNKIESIAPQSL